MQMPEYGVELIEQFIRRENFRCIAMRKLNDINNNIPVTSFIIEIMSTPFLTGYFIIEWLMVDFRKTGNFYCIVQSHGLHCLIHKVKLIDVFFKHTKKNRKGSILICIFLIGMLKSISI